MTTIAYRSGIMAADSRAYVGNKHPAGSKDKIRLLGDGTLIGVSASDLGVPAAVMDWYAEGMPGGPAGLKERLALVDDVGFELLAVDRGGIATFMNGYGLPSRAEGPFYAVGSGDAYAMGAMKWGASAVSAVTVACELDPWSDLPVTIMSHMVEKPRGNDGGD